MKLLLVTYSCAPNCGSEDGVGWNMLRTLSLHHQVVVVTRGTFKDEIESHDLRRQGHDVRFEYVSNPVSKQSFINRNLFQLIYYVWQLRAMLKVRQITKKERFDIVQHLTWIRCWMPSAILGAASGKLVWGPVGGIESIPKNFLRGWEYGRVRETLKRFLAAGSRFDPIVRSLARKASLGLATTRESQIYMNDLGCPTKLLSECACPPRKWITYLRRARVIDHVFALSAWGGCWDGKDFSTAFELSVRPTFPTVNIGWLVMGRPNGS